VEQSALDLDELAARIAAQFAMARDESGLARLEAAARTFRDKIRRDRSDLELISVRFAPLRLDRPRHTIFSNLWVRVGMLDDMLRPSVELVGGNSPRAVCHRLKQLGQDQSARLEALGRLSEMDAVLEIEGPAEHAIAAAGMDLSGVVLEMFGRRDAGGASAPRMPLWCDGDRDHVTLRAFEGCIRLEAQLGPIEWTAEHGIVVSQAFPESVTMALPGRALRTLVEHPLLQGDAVIATAERWRAQTSLTLVADDRPIGRSELAQSLAELTICDDVGF
jgi:hypothetical protein